jgi:hypothetical protein
MILCNYCGDIIEDSPYGGMTPIPMPGPPPQPGQQSYIINIGGYRVDLHAECVESFTTEAKKIKGARKPK